MVSWFKRDKSPDTPEADSGRRRLSAEEIAAAFAPPAAPAPAPPVVPATPAPDADGADAAAAADRKSVV